MKNTSSHNAFCFTLFTLVAMAFGVAFTSSLASNPTLLDYSLVSREIAFSQNQAEADPVESETPSVKSPCPTEPGPIQISLSRAFAVPSILAQTQGEAPSRP